MISVQQKADLLMLEERNAMKSIRTKITLCLILTVLVSLVASGSVSISLNYNSMMSTVEQMMTETAVLAAGRA